MTSHSRTSHSHSSTCQTLEREIETRIHDTYHYALSNGLLFLHKETRNVHALPYTLYPKVDMITREQFQTIQDLQPILNELIHNISLDKQFIESSFKQVVEHDDFIRRLLQIYMQVDYSNKIHMGIHRVDYMPHDDENTHCDQNSEERTDTCSNSVLQMVELNTISSGLGCLGAKLNQMHTDFNHDRDIVIPVSKSLQLLPECLRKGHELWLEKVFQHSSNFKTYSERPVVVFVVQPNEGNISDQRHLEYTLNKSHVGVLRRTLEELISGARLDSEQNLIIDGKYPVSVIYYRSGYGPDEYLSDDYWNIRALMEQSTAISCPTVGYQLVGAKKMQQVLTDIPTLSRFLDHDADKISRVVATFTGIYSLTDPKDISFIQDAIQNPSLYVLKPNREGGGHLVFGEQMVSILKDHRSDQYILMKKICPRGVPATFVRDGIGKEVVGTSELGIYGTFIASPHDVYLNETAGHLLRTKMAVAPEGGFWIGISVVDSLAFSSDQ